MNPRILITGTTGYVGGTVIGALLEKHPEYQVVSLVRTDEQASIIKSGFPSVETVIGGLNISSVFEAEASNVNVVLNLASADHITGAVSLMKGVGQGSNKNAVVVHVFGTVILTEMSDGPGNSASKLYNDMIPADVKEILSFDMSHIHRDVENAFVDAAAKYNVKTAILSPLVIHGIGRSLVKTRSIHIDNLTTTIMVLVEEALKGPQSQAQCKDVSIAIAKTRHAKGLLKSEQVDKLTVEEATRIHPWAPILWDGNSRGAGERLKELGWRSDGKTIFDSIPEMIDAEVGKHGQSQKLTFAGRLN
ncbi:hypothetical protein DE146DRAFT_765969 [Phaeosphaeria sp. MPI-PUGE-AT-0046c]|nr:hypothetical protein DE146DRAFT_765969 [Phaeosphaeria sp. MPI-PUGE-AT-0046c]